MQVLDHRLEVEALEFLGIVEGLAHRIGAGGMLVENLEVQLFRPPVAVGKPARKRAFALAVHGVHVFSDPVPGVLPHRILKTAIVGKRAGLMAWMRDYRPLAGHSSGSWPPFPAFSTAALTWIKDKNFNGNIRGVAPPPPPQTLPKNAEAISVNAAERSRGRLCPQPPSRCRSARGSLPESARVVCSGGQG